MCRCTGKTCDRLSKKIWRHSWKRTNAIGRSSAHWERRALGGAEPVVLDVSSDVVQASASLKECNAEGILGGGVLVRMVVPQYAGPFSSYGGADTGRLGAENRSVASLESSAWDLVWCRYPWKDLSLPELLR